MKEVRQRVFAVVFMFAATWFSAGGAAAELNRIGSDFLVNTYTTGDQNWGANDRIGHGVAVAANGNFLITWNSSQTPEYGAFIDVYGQLHSRDGSPIGLEFQINSHQSFTAPIHSGPDAVADGRGNYVVVYSGFGPILNVQSVGGQRFSPDGTPIGSEFYISEHHGNTHAPVVAADEDGDFVVAWNDDGQFGVGTGIYAQRYTSTGEENGGPFFVSGTGTHPAITSDAEGNFEIVWVYGAIVGQRYDSEGVARGGQFQVNTSTMGGNTYPQVATMPNGAFVVTWQNNNAQDGEVTGIFGRRFASNGDGIGSDFQVNTYTGGYQSFPDVASDADGNFVVLWSNFPIPGNPPGPVNGMVARRYSSSGIPESSEISLTAAARAAVASAPNGDLTIAYIGGPFGFQDVYAAQFAPPSATPTITPTITNTPLPSSTPTITRTPTVTDTPSQTPTRSSTPTSTSTFTPTHTPTLTETPTRTNTSTDTPTSTPTSTSTTTSTATSTPTETPTVTVTHTQTPSPTRPPCICDCNRDLTVTVDELVKAVNIALDSLPIADCAAADANLDNVVTVDELIRGVNNALSGCP